MGSQRKTIPLNWKNGSIIFVLSFLVAAVGVFLLRQTLIPKEELDCYARVITLQKAVDQWDKAYPDKIINDEIDEAALVKAGFLQPLIYDHNLHYYFVGETAHGLRVKCNKHEDNPLVLRLTGDLLLAVLLFLIFCSIRGYVFFPSNEL
ncbi:MAG TPA: hypothetical protein VK791_06455 [bacterium]|jgi:hypothetical protein|nr:hypothetical protein [bacterium]